MYEYRVEVCENCIDPPLEPDAIQRWAKKGWRLVATVVDTEGRQKYYWERKIPEEKSPQFCSFCRALLP